MTYQDTENDALRNKLKGFLGGITFWDSSNVPDEFTLSVPDNCSVVALVPDCCSADFLFFSLNEGVSRKVRVDRGTLYCWKK